MSLVELLEDQGGSREAMRAVTRVYAREEEVLRGWLEERKKGRKRGRMMEGEGEDGEDGVEEEDQRRGVRKRRASEVADVVDDDDDDGGAGTGEETMLDEYNCSEATELLEQSETPARLAHLAYKRASQKLASALATAVGDGRGPFRPEYLLKGWNTIYR